MSVIGAALLAAALLLPLRAAAALDAQAALRDSQAAIGRTVADHRFRDSSGREVRFASLRGKPLVVQFVYTGCFQVCPTATRALADAVREAERVIGPGTFNIATIGFNLPFDTPEAMKEYALKQGVSLPAWKFLSPEKTTLEPLIADFGFRFEPTSAGFDHLLQVSIVDGEGRIYRQLYGDSFNATQFVGPLLELAQNAPRPAGSLAGFIEEVKLLCTIYDPAAGRYRINYAVLIEILVGTSVMVVGIVSVAVEWRRRRRVRSG